MKNVVPERDDLGPFPLDEGWVAASWINSALFCELGLYLDKVGEVEVVETEAMKRGTKRHEQRDREFRADAEAVEKTMAEASADAVEAEKTVLFSEEGMASPSQRVYGVVDRLTVTPERVVATDLKPKKPRVYLSQKYQALTYGLMAEEYLGLDLPVYGAVGNRDDPGEVMWTGALDEFRDDLLETVERIRGVLLGEREPVPTRNENKCRSCSLVEECPDPSA